MLKKKEKKNIRKTIRGKTLKKPVNITFSRKLDMVEAHTIAYLNQRPVLTHSLFCMIRSLKPEPYYTEVFWSNGFIQHF